jgi:microcystin degradation protein MlrC
MGPSAVLAIGPVRVLITSNPTYEWGDEQFRAVGLDPRAATFVVAKNPMNYRHAFPDLADQAIILDTPGPTPAIPHGLPHHFPPIRMTMRSQTCPVPAT